MKQDMKQEYTTPSIQLLGTLKELTATTSNGCGPHEKHFTSTDGFGHGQTGCVVS